MGITTKEWICTPCRLKACILVAICCFPSIFPLSVNGFLNNHRLVRCNCQLLHSLARELTSSIYKFSGLTFLNFTMEGDKIPITEIRKIKHTKLLSTSIDEHQCDVGIAQPFSDKCNQLFNLPHSNTNSQEYCTMLNKINNRIIKKILMLYHVCLS